MGAFQKSELACQTMAGQVILTKKEFLRKNISFVQTIRIWLFLVDIFY